MRQRFVLATEPKPQKRHRIRRVGDKVMSYDPSSKDKADFVTLLLSEYPGTQIMKGAIRATMMFAKPVPKSWSKKKKAEHFGKSITSKPDVDNYGKFYLDALEGVLYENDSQVAWIAMSKIWSEVGSVGLIFEDEGKDTRNI